MKTKTALFDIVNAFYSSGYEVSVAVSQKHNHAKEIAKEALSKKQYDFLVCCGGDGTLNEVINGIMTSKNPVPIGYIPSGSTNDFASTAGLSKDIKKCAESIAKGQSVSLDLGLFGSEYFCYVASFGAFTQTSYQTPQANKNTLGHFAYILEGIKDLTQIKPYHVKFTADGKVYEGDYLFGSISNTTSIGGFLKLNPSLVKLDDGLFEVLLVKNPANPIDVQQLLLALANSDFSNNNLFEFFTASSVTVETKDAFDWSLDGEHTKGNEKIQIDNFKGAIKLIK